MEAGKLGQEPEPHGLSSAQRETAEAATVGVPWEGEESPLEVISDSHEECGEEQAGKMAYKGSKL